MAIKYLEGGKFCAPHGVRGLIKAENYCNSPKELCRFKRIFLPGRGGAMEERKILSASVFGNFVLLGIEGVETREQAQALNGKTLYLLRDDFNLGKNEVLYADLIGLPVVDVKTRKTYGVCSEVKIGVLYPFLIVDLGGGKDAMIPDIPAFVKKKDLGVGIFIEAIEGLIEEPDKRHSADPSGESDPAKVQNKQEEKNPSKTNGRRKKEAVGQKGSDQEAVGDGDKKI